MTTAKDGDSTQPQNNPTIQLWWCNVLHVLNDGYLASLSLLLPFMAADLALNYTQAGLIKSVSISAVSAAQIPAGLVAERAGEIMLLGLGTAWFSLSYIGVLLAATYPLLLLLVFAAGVGGGVYHPVGTALIANVFPPERSGPAIGTLNFFGDVGKVIFPALTGLLVVAIGWRGSLAVQGAIGLAIAVLYLLFFRRAIGQRWRQRKRDRAVAEPAPKERSTLRQRLARWGIRQPRQFTLYTVIGFLDAAVRSAATAFLAFALMGHGVEEGEVGWMMSLTFLGGAAGKLLCGMPIRRWGAKRIILLTEVLMILGFLFLPSIPVGWGLLVFLPLFGFVLNGTSSVIYIGLAPTFERARRSRGYALYYTLNFISVAVAPYAFGWVGDGFGLEAIFYGAGGVMVVGLPLVFFLREDKGEE